MAVPTLIGAGLGALGASVLSDEALEPIILMVLVAVAVIFALRPGWVSGGQSTPTGQEAEGGRVWLGLFVTGLHGGFLAIQRAAELRAQLPAG